MAKKNKKILEKNDKSSDALLTEIEETCAGLIYVSETDAPVLAFSGSTAGDVTGETILQLTGGTRGDAIEEIALDRFFQRLTAIKDWYGEVERVRAKKFLDLQKLIEENLSRPRVFRIGRVRVDIYIVGLDKENRLMGVRTTAVET